MRLQHFANGRLDIISLKCCFFITYFPSSASLSTIDRWWHLWQLNVFTARFMGYLLSGFLQLKLCKNAYFFDKEREGGCVICVCKGLAQTAIYIYQHAPSTCSKSLTSNQKSEAEFPAAQPLNPDQPKQVSETSRLRIAVRCGVALSSPLLSSPTFLLQASWAWNGS